ncbi:dCMP deaminase [Vibrio phage D479]
MKPCTFMGMATLVAQESSCLKYQVGAVIVKNDRVLSTGYNGTPSGAPKCGCEGQRLGFAKSNGAGGYVLTNRQAHTKWSLENEIHAEQNAVCYAARAGLSTEGADIYVTLSPCVNCAKIIVAAGIRRVFVKDVHPSVGPNWRKWLLSHDIEVFVNDPEDRSRWWDSDEYFYRCQTKA